MELEKLAQKISIKNIKLAKQIFVFGIIYSAFFFLFFLNAFKTYRSDISVLIIPKSPAAISQQEQIINNVLELPKTLAFYDALLRYNSDVRDVTDGMSPLERKDVWNKMLIVKRTNSDSSIVRISITAKNENDANQLNLKTVRTLFAVVGSYYDIKKDVDLRIVDGPIAKTYNNLWLSLIFALLAGFVLAFLSLLITFPKNIFSKDFFAKFKMPEEKIAALKNKSFFDFKKDSKMPAEKELEVLKNLYQDEQVKEPFVFKQQEIRPDETEKIEEMKKLTQQMEQDKYPNFPEMPIRGRGKAAAPENLPIADDVFFTNNFSEESIAKEESTPVETEPKTEDKEVKEPTPEELKERLNQLLKGKI